jgi:hypothetical protein
MRSANRELIDLLGQAPKVRTILVVTRELETGGTGPQIFPMDLGWREYATLQRLHLLDHRSQIKNLRAAMNCES